MPAATRSPQSRTHSAPACYLARPASVWITALHGRQPTRSGWQAAATQSRQKGTPDEPACLLVLACSRLALAAPAVAGLAKFRASPTVRCPSSVRRSRHALYEGFRHGHHEEAPC